MGAVGSACVRDAVARFVGDCDFGAVVASPLVACRLIVVRVLAGHRAISSTIHCCMSVVLG
jgi:hypothetical protein